VLQRLQTVKIMRSHSHLYWILRQIFFYTNLYCWQILVFFHVQLTNALFFRCKWGSGADTLQTACIALVYSVAEYCTPVWLNSVHVNKVHMLSNNAMRLITGMVKSTPRQWLPVVRNIAPPRLRRVHPYSVNWRVAGQMINHFCSTNYKLSPSDTSSYKICNMNNWP
jgi:hypothetical protein